MNKMMQLAALSGMLTAGMFPAADLPYHEPHERRPPAKKGKRSAAQKRKRRQAKRNRKINRQRGK